MTLAAREAVGVARQSLRVSWVLASKEYAVCTWVSPKKGRRSESNAAQGSRCSVTE